MGSLAEELMNELNCETAFTIPVFGGIPVPESVVATWIIMAFLVVALPDQKSANRANRKTSGFCGILCDIFTGFFHGDFW